MTIDKIIELGMETFETGDLVVPLFEEEKRILKVSAVGKSLEVETDEGWEISASCNYRHATANEIYEMEKMNNEQAMRLKQEYEAERAFTKCLTVMDFKPTAEVLNSVYDLIICGINPNEINEFLVDLKNAKRMRN